MRHILYIVAVAGLLGAAGRESFAAPGFDCTKAQSASEQLICTDETLSALDREMNNAFNAALEAQREDASALQADQRSWIGLRNRCARGDLSEESARECIAILYRARIAFLADPHYCRISSPGNCDNTNQFMWHGGAAAIRRFLGQQRTIFADEKANASAADMIDGALGGSPDAPKRLGNGWLLFTACMAHDCDLQGAVVVDSLGEVISAALLSYRCVGHACVNDYGLNLFLRSEADREVVEPPVMSWANSAVQQRWFGMGIPPAKLSEVDTKIIGESK